MKIEFTIDGTRISEDCPPGTRLSELLSEVDVPGTLAGVYRAQDGRTVLTDLDLAVRCQGLDLSSLSPEDMPQEVPALTSSELMSMEMGSGRTSA